MVGPKSKVINSRHKVEHFKKVSLMQNNSEKLDKYSRF
jgi:hypothetical protein